MKSRSLVALCCLPLFLASCGDKASDSSFVPSSSSTTQVSSSAVSSALSSSSSPAVLSSAASSLASLSSTSPSSSLVSSASTSAVPTSSVSSASSPSSSQASSSSSQSSATGDRYADYIEPQLVQARCVICHVNGGVSGATRLVFSGGDQQQQVNRLVFENFVGSVDNGDQLILNKVRGGESHGGGAVFASDTEQYQALASFLSELTGNDNSQTGTNGFAKLQLGSAQNTLRRALLLLSGRLPTDSELAAVNGDEASLRSLVRQSLSGTGFHQFLIRGANDRLLTSAFLNGRFLDVMDPNSPRYPVLADMRVDAYGTDQAAIQAFHRWQQKLTYGISRAPLELIAYVVEQDRPYSEILTADYTLVNPYSALIYNATVSFVDDTAATEFVPGQNRGQILMDANFDGDYVQDLGSVIRAHGDFIDYPHAGILNEPAFLNRYPTTDTNRNRARSRWTYFHFLDVDIEKSAARSNDPEALADTNNPTLNNPNCTVCHQVMDPVAGAYQNYGDEGWYRSSWGGQDSLPDSYKRAEDSPYINGDTWYRDMRTPGLGALQPTGTSDSLRWLGGEISNDPRFARAAVKFWWPAIMSEPLRAAPENSGDPDYQAKLAGFEAQQALIAQLADNFIANGLNLKDLLVDMVMSTWFRSTAVNAQLTADERIQLQGVGSGRLLTPEELEAKTRNLIGFAWGESNNADWTADGHWSMLADTFRIYYGGIDSVGITERAEALNSLMSNVALTHAAGVACPTVLFDFNRDDSDKRLFKYVDRYTTPISQAREQVTVTGTDQQTRSDHQFQLAMIAGEQKLRLSFDNPQWDATAQQSLHLVIHSVQVRNSAGETLLAFNGQDLLQVSGAAVSTNDAGDNTGSAYWDSSINALTGWQLWQGYIEVPITLAQADTLTVTVNASKRNLIDRTMLMGAAVVLQLGQGSRGEERLRQQLQYLHGHLLGEWLAPDAAEITASYDLLVELWQTRQILGLPRNAIAWGIENCEIPIDGWWQQDHSAEFADPEFMQGTWMSMLIYLLTDYHYLHE